MIANLRAADGDDEDDNDEDAGTLVEVEDDEPSLLSKRTLAAIFRLNCALAPRLSTENDDVSVEFVVTSLLLLPRDG